MIMRLDFLNFVISTGLVLCLIWNIVAVTTAWIKGEGLYHNWILMHQSCLVMLNLQTCLSM